MTPAADSPNDSKSTTQLTRLDTTTTAMTTHNWSNDSDQQRLETVLSRMNQRLEQDMSDYEAQLIKGIVYFQHGQRQQAIDELTRLAQRAPTFHLAHLIRADMISSPFVNVSDIGQPGLLVDNRKQEIVSALRHEAMMRLQASLSPVDTTKVPVQLLNMGRNTQTALIVDKSRHRLYVYQRKGDDQPPEFIRDFYISTGRATGNKSNEGDLRTPEGVYFITSFIPDEKLPEKYGIGAFPTNYPNAFDQRLGKTGDGIWLHGTDRIYYSRPPLDSEGCVVLSNSDLHKIQHLIKPGVTPVVIADRIDWVDHQQWQQVRQEVLGSLDQWRQDWESMDVSKYLSHYSRSFWSGRHDYSSWQTYKSRVIRQKSFQKIGISDISLFYYPKQASSGKDLVVARFIQDYRSNNFNSETGKQLYFGKEQDHWRIVYEGRAL